MRHLHQPFRNTAIRLCVVWVVAAAVVVPVTALVDPEAIAGALAVAVASLVIAWGSLVPGILFERLEASRSARKGEAQDAAERRAKIASGRWSSFLAGMLIRLTGTVALFALCRYHLAESSQLLLLMVVSWYLILLVSEVIFLTGEMQEGVSGELDPVESNPVLENVIE